MSVNKKITYGDGSGNSINGDVIIAPPPAPPQGSFTFDRTDISFDSTLRTFDQT